MSRLARQAAQRGAALLMAMLTVALVATFAAAALWQQWRGIEVETAERARMQSEWILTGALDWARLLLREDARSSGNGGGVDHLAEPWAIPLQEARLSSFLAADKNNNAPDNPNEVMEAFLSGQIIDLQSMLNVTNMVVNGKVQEDEYKAFGKLFDLLGLPLSQLDTLVENLRFALDTSESNRSSPQAALVPQRLDQLVWLGLPASSVSVLQPYVTVLPGHTDLNFNTASAEAIFARLPAISMGGAQNVVAARENAPFRIIADIQKVAPEAAAGQGVSVFTTFFEVRSRLRLDKMVVEERAIVQRPANTREVNVIYRQRGIVDPTALSQVAARTR